MLANSCAFVRPNSVNAAANAALVGAKTVNGPVPINVYQSSGYHGFDQNT